MPSRPSRHACAIAGALALIITLAVPAQQARAGLFYVATCQADVLGATTSPFEDFATRGMATRRACTPGARGARMILRRSGIMAAARRLTSP